VASTAWFGCADLLDSADRASDSHKDMVSKAFAVRWSCMRSAEMTLIHIEAGPIQGSAKRWLNGFE